MLKPNTRSQSLTSQDSYSAVIIADLVADVPVAPPETEQDPSKAMTVKTNLGYDGHMDGESSPAVLNVNSEELDNMRNMKSNGAGISRGVILNAVQFGQQEAKSKTDEKPIQLTNSLSVQVLTQPVAESPGFKDMSIGRKIAFGFSFLPSILFVLCFAIILPCNVPKPCVKEAWLTTLNNTEVTSDLKIPQDVKFTALEGSDSYLITLESSKGSLQNKEELFKRSTYFSCSKVANNDKDCIVMDESGKIYIFSPPNDKIVWDSVSENGEQASQPVLLPDCDKDGFSDIAVAVSNTKIKVLYSGNIVTNLEVSDCESLPTRLMSWTRENSSDLIFFCEKEGKDTLVKVPQSLWCRSDKKSEEKITVLDSRIKKESILHPTEDGLVIWSGDDVIMLQPNGSSLWQISSDSHLDKNRFILQGKFIGADRQIALLSSDLSSGLEITILDASSGSLMKNTSFPKFEATEVTLIQGTEKDFALILLKKLKVGLVSEAMTHINDFSTKIVNYVSNEESNATQLNSENDVTEEIAFLDLTGTHHTVKDLNSNHEQGPPYKVSMTAVPDKKEDNLNIYLLRIFEGATSTKISEIRNIQVANWDISVKSQQCLQK